jgi:hypothetical protein
MSAKTDDLAASEKTIQANSETMHPGDDQAHRLEAMGYAQELKRSLGMVSILGLSFAIMAVPFGTSTTLNIALTDGGPVTILYGVCWAYLDSAIFCLFVRWLMTVDLCLLCLFVYGR